jgi:tetratricopeptide (TPR) repeat protein
MARHIGKRNLRDFRAELLQGLRLEQESRLQEAEQVYADILKAEPTNFYALYRRAICCATRGDDLEALGLIQAALKRNATTEAAADCGVILERLGRAAEAIETYDRALILNPNNPLALLHRGKLFTTLGQHAKAVASFERLLARHPDHAEAHNSLGHLLVQLGRHREAIAAFTRAMALDPDSANAHFNRALALLLLGDFEAG